MAGIKEKNLSEFFVGQGDMIYFDPVTDFSDATLATLTNGKSFGNIKEDSTGWTGDDVTTTTVRNEQGNPIVTVPTAGTYAWEFTLAEFDDETVKMLLQGADIDVSDLTADWVKKEGTSVIGVGTELPVIEMPVGLVNQTLNKTILAPKGQVTSSLVIEDKMVCIHCVVTAQMVNTKSLKTITIINGSLTYDTTNA